MIPCPICGKGYDLAIGRSPAGITFRHPDGRECNKIPSACPCCGALIATGAACRECMAFHDCDAGRQHPACPPWFKAGPPPDTTSRS